MATSIVNQYLLSNKPNVPDRRPSYKSMKSVGTSSQEVLDGRADFILSYVHNP